MIHHVSIAAREPQHVAEVLAELMNGKCFPFGPLEGAFMAASGDANGTMFEVYPERATLDIPDRDDQVIFRKTRHRRKRPFQSSCRCRASRKRSRYRCSRGLARQDFRPRHAGAQAVLPRRRVLAGKPAADEVATPAMAQEYVDFLKGVQTAKMSDPESPADAGDPFERAAIARRRECRDVAQSLRWILAPGDGARLLVAETSLKERHGPRGADANRLCLQISD